MDDLSQLRKFYTKEEIIKMWNDCIPDPSKYKGRRFKLITGTNPFKDKKDDTIHTS